MDASRAPELSVLIVSYNTRELTLACLESLERTTAGIELETIVVDNASADGSAEAIASRFPRALLLPQDENLGFARAINLAAGRARGELLLLLNPDSLVLEGTIANVLRFAREHPEAGIVGGRTLMADGRLDPRSCWGRETPWSAFCRAAGLSVLFRRSRLFDPESLGRWARDSVREVDIVTGCFLLVRQLVWEELGGFDEDFFMYGEDADLCLRARARGVRCWITPDAELYHYGAASEPVRADKMVRLFRAKARLFVKHWSPLAARWGLRMLDLWALTRMLAFRGLAALRPSARGRAEVWSTIWSRRADWKAPADEPRHRAS